MKSILQLLQEAKGKAKITTLVQNDSVVLKQLLYYAYDPYIKFGIQKTTFPKGEGEGKEEVQLNEISDDIQAILDEPIISKRINLILECKMDYNPEGFELLKRTILKDWKCGINTKSINKAFPGLITEFNIMLAQKVDWNKLRYPCIGQIKLDGVRCIVNNGGIFTRSGRAILGCDHIWEAVKKELDETVDGQKLSLDGELMVKDMYFDQASGNIRSHAESPDARFYIFDIFSFDKDHYMNGNPYHARQTFIERMVRHNNVLRDIPYFHIHSRDQANTRFAQALDQGHEGLILKDPLHKYDFKRSYSWMKMKDIVSYDLECIGFYEGESGTKFEGSLGGIIVDFRGVEVRVGGGFSDFQRDLIWQNQDTFLGKIAEVYAQNETEAGSLRHPQFLIWRTDKNETD